MDKKINMFHSIKNKIASRRVRSKSYIRLKDGKRSPHPCLADTTYETEYKEDSCNTECKDSCDILDLRTCVRKEVRRDAMGSTHMQMDVEKLRHFILRQMMSECNMF